MNLFSKCARRLRLWVKLYSLMTAPAWDAELQLEQAAEWQPNDVY